MLTRNNSLRSGLASTKLAYLKCRANRRRFPSRKKSGSRKLEPRWCLPSYLPSKVRMGFGGSKVFIACCIACCQTAFGMPRWLQRARAMKGENLALDLGCPAPSAPARVRAPYSNSSGIMFGGNFKVLRLLGAPRVGSTTTADISIWSISTLALARSVARMSSTL